MKNLLTAHRLSIPIILPVSGTITLFQVCCAPLEKHLLVPNVDDTILAH